VSKAVLRGYQRRTVKAIAEVFVGDPIHSLANKTSATAVARSRKRHSYKPLTKQFRREVIYVRRRDRFKIDNRWVEPAEVYPNSEAWGADGFTFTGKDAAFAKLSELA
jgi:hypothetical protein